MKKLIYLFCIICGVWACNDDYLIDGGVANPFVGVSTYEYLKSNREFDTLVIAIDKAGLKDVVNGEATLFGLTNVSFSTYVKNELEFRRKKYGQSAQYTFDSIPENVLRDSLKSYIIEKLLPRDSLTKEGTICRTLSGKFVRISLEPFDDYQDQLTIKPEYVYYTDKRGARFDTYDEIKDGLITNKNEKDVRERIQTSGIITTNGVVHVINYAHSFAFHDPLNQ